MTTNECHFLVPQHWTGSRTRAHRSQPKPNAGPRFPALAGSRFEAVRRTAPREAENQCSNWMRVKPSGVSRQLHGGDARRATHTYKAAPEFGGSALPRRAARYRYRGLPHAESHKQFVFQADEKARSARISLVARTASKLVIDSASLHGAWCPIHKATECDHLFRIDRRVAAQQNVGSAPSHVR